jgi:FtsH-binding integral membrane protein
MPRFPLMNNILHEFEDLRKENSRLKTITILLLVTLISGFWVALVVNFFSSSLADSDFTDFYVLAGASLIIGVLIYLFSKSNKIGWFLLSLFVSFLLGTFTSSVRISVIDFIENPEVWRSILLVVMFFNTLAAFILLIHTKTKKRLLISNVMYVTCIGLCVLLSIGGFLLVS